MNPYANDVDECDADVSIDYVRLILWFVRSRSMKFLTIASYIDTVVVFYAANSPYTDSIVNVGGLVVVLLLMAHIFAIRRMK